MIVSGQSASTDGPVPVVTHVLSIPSCFSYTSPNNAWFPALRIVCNVCSTRMRRTWCIGLSDLSSAAVVSATVVQSSTFERYFAQIRYVCNAGNRAHGTPWETSTLLLYCYSFSLLMPPQAICAAEAIMLLLCPVPTWTRQHGRRVHYTCCSGGILWPRADLSYLVFLGPRGFFVWNNVWCIQISQLGYCCRDHRQISVAHILRPLIYRQMIERLSVHIYEVTLYVEQG